MKGLPTGVYLQLLERHSIDPNFWCSEEYFQKAGLEIKREGDTYWIEDEGMMVFPPINLQTGLGEWLICSPDKIWSDFVGTEDVFFSPIEKEFLDYEYLYNPQDFLKMEGKKWGVFRKNSRKFPDRCGQRLIYDAIKSLELMVGWGQVKDQLKEVMIDWLGGVSGEVQE